MKKFNFANIDWKTLLTWSGFVAAWVYFWERFYSWVLFIVVISLLTHMVHEQEQAMNDLEDSAEKEAMHIQDKIDQGSEDTYDKIKKMTEESDKKWKEESEALQNARKSSH